MTAPERLKYARTCNRHARREIRKLTYELLRIAECGTLVDSRESDELRGLIPSLATLVSSVEMGAHHLRRLETFIVKSPAERRTRL